MSESSPPEITIAVSSVPPEIPGSKQLEASKKRAHALALENGAMLQVNMQIENENERLAVVGQQLIIPQKLQKHYKQQMQNTPAYLAQLDKLTIRIDQHKQSLAELEQRYITSFESGLSKKEAAVRLNRRGQNIISNQSTLSVSESVSQFIFSSTNSLVVTAAGLLIISYFVSENRSFANLWLLLPLGISVILTTLASHYRATKSNALGSVANDYRRLTEHKVTVLRDGKEISIKATQLVSGDVCLLSAGTRVPADMRVIEGTVQVDQSILVGSAAVATKQPKCHHSSPFEAENIIFLGTEIVEGSCKALVFNCGDKSALGKLSHQMEVYSHYDSPLMADVKFFYKREVALAIFFSLVFGIIGQWSASGEYALADKGSRTLLFVSGIILSTIPLLFNLILVLGLGFYEKKLRIIGIFFSKLDYINSFASLGAICVGSTDVFIDYAAKSVSRFLPTVDRNESDLVRAVLATCLPDESMLVNYVAHNVTALAPEEVLALRECVVAVDQVGQLMRKTINDVEYIRGPLERIRALVTAGEEMEREAQIHSEKGETVLAYASREVGENVTILLGIVAITNPVNHATIVAVEQLRLMGVKLFPLFHRTGFETEAYMSRLVAKAGMKPLLDQQGVSGLVKNADDRPEKAIVEADEGLEAESADESETELIPTDVSVVPLHVIEEIDASVTKSVRQTDPIAPQLLRGRKLAVLSAHRLSELLTTAKSVIGFFEVSFIQKLRVTVALKRTCTVGFVGSVNGDTPALRAADIGISTSTDGIVARASDVLIARPDTLAAIAAAIYTSRRCVNNIRRAVMYLLSQVVPRLSPLLMSLAFAYPLPLSVALIVTGSLLIDLPIACGLLLETAEYDVPHRLPRSERRERLISLRMLTVAIALIGVVGSLAGFLGYHESFSDQGFDPKGLPGLGNAAFVVFGEATTSEPGLPPTRGYPLDLSLQVLENVHLCGRVGLYATLTPTGLAAVPLRDRCDGDVFSLDVFNRYCYAFNRTSTYSPVRQDTVALFEQQKLVAGVLFERDELGLPECGNPNRDGIYVPRGFYTQAHQKTVDKAMQDYKCTVNDATCFTSVALEYAQTAFFTNVAFFGAFSAFLVLRTELFSFFHIGVVNNNVWLPVGLLTSIALVLFVTYIPPFQDWFGTRPVSLSNLFCPAMPFIILLFFAEEIRKTHIRKNSATGRWLMERTMW